MSKFMTEEIKTNNTLALVIVGFEATSLNDFVKDLKTNSLIKDKNFTDGQYRSIPAPPGTPPVAVSYRTKNNSFLTIDYSILDRKLVIFQENYTNNNTDQDRKILEILKSLLIMAPSSKISAFGINYSTDIVQDKKLCLFNPSIEDKLGKEYWDTNIGFKTELAFKNTDYTTVYTIFKNEALSQERGSRCYSFNCNFDFILNIDDKSSKIINAFKNNNEYYNIYMRKMENILEL